MAGEFEKMVNSFKNYKPEHSTGRSAEERRLRGALKHIAKYGKDTVLHTFNVPSFSNPKVTYDVKQMLNGEWTCTCPDFQYRQQPKYKIEYKQVSGEWVDSAFNNENNFPFSETAAQKILDSVRRKSNYRMVPFEHYGECKHIPYAKIHNREDVAYGYGAIEAHRRLTKLASEALSPQPVAKNGNCGYSPRLPKYKGKYRLECNITHLCSKKDSGYKPNWCQYTDKGKGPFTRQEAEQIINEKCVGKWKGWIRMVKIG